VADRYNPRTLQSAALQGADPNSHLGGSDDGYLLSYRVTIEGDKLDGPETSAEVVVRDWIAGRPIAIGGGLIFDCRGHWPCLLIVLCVYKRKKGRMQGVVRPPRRFQGVL